MTRGAAHPAQLRAEAVAAVLAGQALTEVARRYGLSKQTVNEWVQADPRTVRTDHQARAAQITDRLFDILNVHLDTLSAQLQAATRPAWLEKQSAAELAALVAVERDTTLRLLAGLFPVEPERPELAGPTDTPPSTTDDDH